MKEIKSKVFANGTVYLLQTDDGFPVEVTDTFLPAYTKDAIGRKQNALQNYELGTRKDRWMIGVSVMSGCPVRCKFCATGKLKKWRNLTAQEIIGQVLFIIQKHPEIKPSESVEFKINYTRMGEPFLNLDAVKEAIWILDRGLCNTRIHHYVSSIGVRGSDFSWIRDNMTLQLSLHSLDEKRRDNLIPFNRKLSIAELGQVRTGSNLKTTLNMTLVDETDFDIEKLKGHFSPEHFFVKLSPINANCISGKNDLGEGVIKTINLV